MADQSCFTVAAKNNFPMTTSIGCDDANVRHNNGKNAALHLPLGSVEPVEVSMDSNQNESIVLPDSSAISAPDTIDETGNYRTVPVRDLITTFEQQTRPTLRYKVVREDKMPMFSMPNTDQHTLLETSNVSLTNTNGGVAASTQQAEEELNQELYGFLRLVDDFQQQKGLQRALPNVPKYEYHF